MKRGQKLHLIFSALYACVIAFPSENSLNLVDSNGAEHERLSSLKGENITAKSDEVVDAKPVHERFPHAVLYGRLCSGTIISPTWVLTAAHCTINTLDNRVVAGTNNTQDGSGIVGFVKRRVIHPRFTIGPYWLNAHKYNLEQVAARYDLLLAELEDPLPLDNITLAAAKLNENFDLDPKTPVAFAGYGATYHRGGMSAQMHERHFELLSEEECSTLEEYDSQDMICARGRPPNYDFACDGDSGGGLVDENGILLGVLSWGESDAIDCRKGTMLYFTKIAVARDWIREVTNV